MPHSENSSDSASQVPLLCPKCKRSDLQRIARKGFWQNKVLPYFGYYPWECPVCRTVFSLKKRNIRRKRHRKPSRS
jgi:hypothetical protein